MDGQEFWMPKPNHFYNNKVWTYEEAKSYSETGIYPDRLLDIIRKKFEEENKIKESKS